MTGRHKRYHEKSVDRAGILPQTVGREIDRHDELIPAFWDLQCSCHRFGRMARRSRRVFLHVLLQQGTQVIAAAFTTGLVCMPMILIFGQIRGAYLGGSLLTFFLGYCILFFKGGFLLSAYPFSAALILAGFDMQEYNGATQAPSVLLALAGMAAVLVLTMAILLLSHPSQKAGNSKRKKVKKGRGRRRAR